MSINININNEKFRYDAYQIINLFYPYEEINFIKDSTDYNIVVKAEDSIAIQNDNYSKHYDIDNTIALKQNVKWIIYDYFSKLTGKIHPWGTLVGIRPTKIAQSLMDEGYNYQEIIKHYKEYFLASEEKAKLCYEVAFNQRELLRSNKKTISLYIGMPFCPTRCAYCSFASNAIGGKKSLVTSYLQALKYEIKMIAKYIGEKTLVIENVYFGGGTPTSVDNMEFAEIMKEIYNAFIKDTKAHEFTVEAGRPDSITEEKLLTMKEYGVTRISINPQTMNNDTLKRIGRLHSVEDVIHKFHMARKMGFDNINMDLIVGLSGEGLDEIINSCNEITKLNPESLTIHGMSIKRGSKHFEELLNHKYSNRLEIDELKDMFYNTRVTAEMLQMRPYYLYRQKNMIGNMENIGYAKQGMECIYNIKIMEENQTIIALGADAATKVVFQEENRIERFANLKDVGEYVKRIDEMVKKKIALLNTLYID